MDYRPNWVPWNPAQGRPFAAVLIFVPGRRNGHSEGESPCTNYIPGSWKRFPSGSRGAQYPNILLNEIVLLPSHQLPEEPSKSQPFGSAGGWSRERLLAGYPTSQPRSACFHASRFTSAMDSVRGMPLGQVRTQFCALAHSCMPPGPMRAARRSLLFIAPVGCMLNKRTWLIMAAPTN